MKISYLVTVCNEEKEAKNLLSFLCKNIREEDEIVVLWDTTKNNQFLSQYLGELNKQGHIKMISDKFDGHFADWKNKGFKHCVGDYIFQIDADEIPNESLIENLPYILEDNSHIDLFLVPRINIVNGITEEHIQKWRWHRDGKGWINFPDYQNRIYRNNYPQIQWKNRVHEVINGYKEFAPLPGFEEFSLYHIKDIERQEKQNNYYNTL